MDALNDVRLNGRRDWLKAAALAAGAAIFTATAGCQKSKSSAGSSTADEDYSDEEYVWLCCHVNLPLFKAHDHPALRIVEQELGVRATIAGPDSDDVRALNAQIDETAARKPAGMMIVGWNPAQMREVIDRTVDAGIPVVCVDADIPQSKRLAFIGTDWYDLGVRQGQAMLEALGDRARGKVAMLGLTEQEIDIRAFAGFRSVVEPAGLDVLAPQNDEGKQRKATEIAANLIANTDDLIGIAGFDSESGPGFGQAIIEADRAGKIVATCVDAEKPHLQLVKDGVITACVGQKRELFTYLGVKALFEVNRRRLKFTTDDHKLGLYPIPTHYYTGTYTVTKDNVDYFLAEFSGAAMNKLRFALLGAGFWARYQLAAWRELPGVECVAIYNRTRSKAEELAQRFGVARVYDDLERLFSNEKLDFIDIVTDAGTHAPLVRAAAERRIPVICQKPMATSLDEAEGMVAACRKSNTPFFVHENWRWQAPIREVRHILDDGLIGRPFRARIDMISGFPVFQNQPFLQNLEQFIIADVGSHILDVARFLFGEARRLYCQTQRVHVGIRGEDVATVVLTTDRDVNVVCQMAYAENHLEHDCFPQTLLFIEGTRGSIELAPDYWVRLTAENGTLARRYPPTMFSWCDPQYAVVQSSIVACHTNLVHGLQGNPKVETTGEDNLRTMRLVFKSYESTARNEVITFL